MFRGVLARINSRSVGLRMARREVARNKVQSFLIILIIAMPVALGAFAITYRESRQLTEDERATFYLGQAQVKVVQNLPPSQFNYQNPLDEYAIYFNPDNPDPRSGGNPDEIKRVSPNSVLAGYTWLSHETSRVLVKTAFGQTNMQVDEVEAWNKSLEGRFFDFNGRVPENQGEALVNKAALARLGAALGDSVKLLELDKTLKIVGTIEDAQSGTNKSQLFVLPGSVITSSSGPAAISYYGSGPAKTSWGKITELNKLGFGILSRDVILNLPAKSDVPLYLAGGYSPRESISDLIQVLVLLPILLLPVVILTGSAFSFGARRQTQSIAVMSSLGAKKSTLRFITIANGLWLGLLGGFVGTGIGVVSSYLISPSLFDGSKIAYPGLHVPAVQLTLVVIGGAMIGALVSVIPAFAAAKVEVLSTLRGSRRDASVTKKPAVFGLVLIILGVTGLLVSVPLWVYLDAQSTRDALGWQTVSKYAQITLVMTLISSLAAILGMVIGSPWLLVLAKSIFRKSGSTANYATNDLVFNRKRFTAVIASVIATSFVSTIVLSFVYTVYRPQIDEYRPSGEVNQLQTSFGYPAFQLDSKKDVEDYIGLLTESAEKAIVSARDIAPVRSSAVISLHRSFEAEGYKTYDTGETMLGIEGEIPYVKLDYNYLCPMMGASPDHKRIIDAYTSNNWRLVKEIESQEKYADCQRVVRTPTNFFVATPEEFRVLLGGRVDSRAESALARGEAVVFSKGFLTDGKLQLYWHPSGLGSLALGEEFLPATKFEPPRDVNDNLIDFGNPSRTEKLSAVLSSSPNSSLNFVIPPQTATRLGIDFQPMLAFVNFERELTPIEQDMLQETLPMYSLESGPQLDLEAISWIIALLSGLFVLASTAIALGLAQIESRADHSTLWSIGASKLFRAKVVSLQAFLLSVLGTVCGSTVGFLTVYVLSSSLHEDFKLPISQSLFLVVGVPLIASLGFLVCTPKRYKYSNRLSLD